MGSGDDGDVACWYVTFGFRGRLKGDSHTFSGSGRVRGIVKYFSPHTNLGIVRVARDHFRMIWAGITFITKIKGRECLVRVLHVSGTIKKAQQATIRHDRIKLEEAKAVLESLGVDVAATAEKNEKDILAADV